MFSQRLIIAASNWDLVFKLLVILIKQSPQGVYGRNTFCRREVQGQTVIQHDSEEINGLNHDVDYSNS